MKRYFFGPVISATEQVAASRSRVLSLDRYLLGSTRISVCGERGQTGKHSTFAVVYTKADGRR